MDDLTHEEWFNQPTTIGLTIYIEHRPKLGPEPERWTPEQRREFCAGLRDVVAAHDKTADVVYQANNTPDDKLPTSVIIWLNGWYDDPTPEDRFNRSYAAPDPFEMRRHVAQHGYHVSTIHYGFDPVMAG